MAYGTAEYGHGTVYRSMLGQKNYLAHLLRMGASETLLNEFALNDHLVPSATIMQCWHSHLHLEASVFVTLTTSSTHIHFLIQLTYS